MANRLLRHVEYDHKYEPHEPVYANFTDLDFNTVNRIIFGCAIGLGLVFVLVMPRAGNRNPESDAIEFALFLLLILVFTPLSFGYLFAWLLFPYGHRAPNSRGSECDRHPARKRGECRRAFGTLDSFPGNGADLRERVVRNLAALRRTGGRVGNGKTRWRQFGNRASVTLEKGLRHGREPATAKQQRHTQAHL